MGLLIKLPEGGRLYWKPGKLITNGSRTLSDPEIATMVARIEMIHASGIETMKYLFHRFSTKRGSHPHDRVPTIPFAFTTPTEGRTNLALPAQMVWWGDTARFIVSNLTDRAIFPHDDGSAPVGELQL